VIKRIGWLLWLGSAAALSVGAVDSTALLAVGERTWPVLLFALSITLVADNAARAGVFTSVAESLAHLARGRRRLLFGLVIALAVVCTVDDARMWGQSDV
jgi:arsenical pump membrane protein